MKIQSNQTEKNHNSEEKILAEKLRRAEEQERNGQMRSFEEFCAEMKIKYGVK